mgnify:CR=1 FL=1
MFIPRKALVWVLAGFVLAGGYLVFDSLAPREEPVMQEVIYRARSSDPPVFYVKTQEKLLALTFDIGWGSRTLPLILPVLDRFDQKATFFVAAPWAKEHPNLVKQIVEAGHEIASHGDKHDNLSQFSREQVAKNISRAHRVIKEVSGVEPRFFRPPYGDYDDLVVATARELGYETIIWSVDSMDWKNPGVDYMIRRVTREIFPGAILLFHASDSCRQTHQALPTIIQNLRAQGYQLVTLGELFEAGEPGRDDPRGKPYKPNMPRES